MTQFVRLEAAPRKLSSHPANQHTHAQDTSKQQLVSIFLFSSSRPFLDLLLLLVQLLQLACLGACHLEGLGGELVEVSEPGLAQHRAQLGRVTVLGITQLPVEYEIALSLLHVGTLVVEV